MLTMCWNDQRHSPLNRFEAVFGLSQQQMQNFCPLTPVYHEADVDLSKRRAAGDNLEVYLELQLLQNRSATGGLEMYNNCSSRRHLALQAMTKDLQLTDSLNRLSRQQCKEAPFLACVSGKDISRPELPRS